MSSPPVFAAATGLIPAGPAIDSGQAACQEGNHRPAAGDPGRLASLVQAHIKEVWRALRRLGVPIEALDDATQEVFMVAARKLCSIDRGRERQFLYGTALRIAANARRARAHREHVIDSLARAAGPSNAPPTDALLDDKRMRELLDRVLDRMPEDLREVLVLAELEGLSGHEMADLLDIPTGTVASRLRRARSRFFALARTMRCRYGDGGDP